MQSISDYNVIDFCRLNDFRVHSSHTVFSVKTVKLDPSISVKLLLFRYLVDPLKLHYKSHQSLPQTERLIRMGVGLTSLLTIGILTAGLLSTSSSTRSSTDPTIIIELPTEEQASTPQVTHHKIRKGKNLEDTDSGSEEPRMERRNYIPIRRYDTLYGPFPDPWIPMMMASSESGMAPSMTDPSYTTTEPSQTYGYTSPPAYSPTYTAPSTQPMQAANGQYYYPANLIPPHIRHYIDGKLMRRFGSISRQDMSMSSAFGYGFPSMGGIRADPRLFDPYGAADEFGGAYERSDFYYVLPILLVIGLGSFLIPIISTFFTAMVTSSSALGGCCGRRKRYGIPPALESIFGSGNGTNTGYGQLLGPLFETWNHIESAIDKAGIKWGKPTNSTQQSLSQSHKSDHESITGQDRSKNKST